MHTNETQVFQNFNVTQTQRNERFNFPTHYYNLEKNIEKYKLCMILTNRSCSDDLPEKQLFFILFMATSVPRHFP
jgi:hypothetical protein